jgi:hypothetical protein
MRRLIAITAIAVLMVSLNAPLLAATCEHTKPMAACHGVEEQKAQKPHCERMHEHDAQKADGDEESTPVSGNVTIQSAPSQNCPMDCCQLGHRTNAVVLAGTTALPQPSPSEQTPSILSVIFSRTGFSSHTDRGPPSA